MPRAKRGTDVGILTAALAGLEAQRQRIEDQIARVRALLGKGRGGRLGQAAKTRAVRQLSAAARKRISSAQKRRWREFRKRRAAAAG